MSIALSALLYVVYVMEQLACQRYLCTVIGHLSDIKDRPASMHTGRLLSTLPNILVVRIEYLICVSVCVQKLSFKGFGIDIWQCDTHRPYI